MLINAVKNLKYKKVKYLKENIFQAMKQKQKKEKKKHAQLHFQDFELQLLFTFAYPQRESIVLQSNFQNGEFDGFTRFEASRI